MDEFETKLSPTDEAVYQGWKEVYAAPSDSGSDYDLRGAFKGGVLPDERTGHWPDTFKKPSHPTFSNESIYANKDAGSWRGEVFVPPQEVDLSDAVPAAPEVPYRLDEEVDLSDAMPEEDFRIHEATRRLGESIRAPLEHPLGTHEMFMLNLAALAGKGWNERLDEAIGDGPIGPRLVSTFREMWKGAKETFSKDLQKAAKDVTEHGALSKEVAKDALGATRDAVVGGTSGLAQLPAIGVDLAQQAAQATIGSLAGIASPKAEQYFDAFGNTISDSFHSGTNIVTDAIAGATGADKESASYKTAENITPLVAPVPLGAVGKVGKLGEAVAEEVPKLAAKADEIAAKTASALTPAVAKVTKAGASVATAHLVSSALGIHVPAAMEPFYDALAGWLGIKTGKGAIEDFVKAKLDDVAATAKIVSETPVGEKAVEAMGRTAQKEADAAASQVKANSETMAAMREKLTPEEAQALDAKNSQGGPLYPDDNPMLGKTAKAIRAEEAKAKQAQDIYENLAQKAATLKNRSAFNRYADDFGKFAIKSGVNVAAGATVGAAIGGAASPVGDNDSWLSGAILGILVGTGATALEAPGAARASMRSVNKSEMVQKGMTALSSDHPDYATAQKNLASLPDQIRDNIYVMTGLAAAKGESIIPMTSAEMKGGNAQSPAGWHQAGKGTSYVNIDQLQAGNIPHEISHGFSETMGWMESDNPVRKSVERMLTSDDLKVEARLGAAKKLYEDRATADVGKPVILNHDAMVNEILADMASDIIQSHTPEGLYGGMSPMQKLGRGLRKYLPGSDHKSTGAFGFPVSPEMIRVTESDIFKIGKLAKDRPAGEVKPKVASEPKVADSTPPIEKTYPAEVDQAAKALEALKYKKSEARAMAELAHDELTGGKVEELVARALKNKNNPTPLLPSFMPSHHPDAIDKVAMRRKSDGKVFVGKTSPVHWMMPGEIPELRDRFTLGGADRYEDGWVDKKGNFLTKEEAHARAVKIGQIEKDFKTEYKGNLSSLDMKEGGKFMPSPVQKAQVSAEEYVKKGVGRILPPATAKLDIENAKKIAKDYEALPKVDNSPEARDSYKAFADEVNAQYQHALDSGIRFEFTKDDPYKSSEEMMHDVDKNGRLKVFTGGEDHPYTGESTKDSSGLTVNEKFRAIHDLYGHASEGNQFGPLGEERAWRKHSAMFSDAARPAMTSETRGQNSWVNYGPHMFDENGWKGDKSHPGYIPPSERLFAEQKAALLPEAHSRLPEGVANRAIEQAKASVARPESATGSLQRMPPPGATKSLGEPFSGKTIEAGEPSWSIRLKELEAIESPTPQEKAEEAQLHHRAISEYGSYQNWFEKTGAEKDYLGNLFGEAEQKRAIDANGDSGLFMPSSHPDAIKEAAIKDGRGKIYQGLYHGLIEHQNKSKISGPVTYGWVDGKGKFLNRKEALDRARHVGQDIRDASEIAGLHTGDIPQEGINFMPSDHPEAITEVAVKWRGKIFPGGPLHFHAEEEMFSTYPHLNQNKIPATMVSGFIDKNGKFYTRKEAKEHAEKIGQYVQPKMAHSSELESGAFDEGRKFMPSPEIPKEYEKIAKQYGIRYDGLQEGYKHIAAKHSFSDTTHRSSFTIPETASPEEFLAKIKAVRDRMNGNDGDKMSLMPSPNKQGFYSKLEDVLEKKMGNKASVEQIKGLIKSGGVKSDEMKWSGLDDYLKEQEKLGLPVNKEDILSYLMENNVQLQEVKRGEGLAPSSEEYRQLKEAHDKAVQEYHELANVPERKQPEHSVKMGEASHKMTELREQMRALEGDVASTKYGQYVLPGGDPGSYRELLLTLPTTRRSLTEVEGIEKRRLGLKGNLNTKEMARYNELSRIDLDPASDFKSPHFSESNVLAHVRYDTRTDARGNRTMHVAEVQSDWHQQGRRKGYETGKLSPESHARLLELNEKYDKTPLKLTEPERNEMLDLRHDANQVGVPDAPFKKNWAELAMKRMIRLASESGHDAISWDTGETQAARYDLGKHVDSISYSKNADGTYDVVAHPKGENAAGTISRGDLTQDGIANFVGKDVADKIISGEGEEIVDINGKNPEYVLRGQDLKVGGEGMKAFYDHILPSIANNLGKKFGSKAGEGKFSSVHPSSKYGAYYDGVNNSWRIIDVANNHLARFEDGRPMSGMSKGEAFKTLDAMGGDAKVHQLPITDAMRQSVITEGFPMFMPSASPTAIKEAAIRTPEGKIYSGAMHVSALHQAIYDRREAGLPEMRLTESDTGFVTNGGEFLDRKEALQRALNEKQITERTYKEAADHYTAGEMKPDYGSLESLNFSKAKKNTIKSLAELPEIKVK